MILITNVGNRNITYQGQTIDKLTEGSRVSFRDYTEGIYRSGIIDPLDIQIIDVILDAHSRELSKIVLVATNQLRSDHPDQDTIFAALLMKNKLASVPKYAHIEVHIEELPISIEKTAELMGWYKRLLLRWHDQNPGAHFLICDAGGAPQMKTPLKIMAEFILPYEQYNVLYVKQRNGELIDVDRDEYRKVITSYQVEALLNSLEYKAAASLWAKSSQLNADKDKVLLLLRYGSARIGFLTDEIDRYRNKIGAAYKNQPPEQVKFYSDSSILADALHLLPGQVERARDLLAGCAHMYDQGWQNGFYNESVLMARQFIEFALQAIVEQHLGIPVLSDYKGARDALRKYASERQITYMGGGIIADSVPGLITISRQAARREVQPLLESFANIEIDPSESQDKTLGTLRNTLVHNGRSVTRERLELYCPRFEKVLRSWLEILKPGKPFTGLNELIRKELRAF